MSARPEMPDQSAIRDRRSKWYAPRSIWRSFALRPRFFVALLAGISAIFVLPASMNAAIREALGWCIGGGVYLCMAFEIMTRCNTDKIRSRAAEQDDSRTVILCLILLAMCSSFTAIVALVGEAKAASGEARLLYILLAAATIVIAWTVIQTVFTLHYAHEHYLLQAGPDGNNEGLAFPNDKHPDYWDFFYFATSIGATSQTSDVAINSKVLRRLVTLHAIVSFFFNTMVLALTVNLAASLA